VLLSAIWLCPGCCNAAAARRFRDSNGNDEAVDELLQVTWEVARNVPTTTAGAIATLKYLGQIGPENACQEYRDWLAMLHGNLAKALARVTDSAYPRYVD